MSHNSCNISFQFADYIDVIYPPELEIKDTTDSHNFASYLDLLLEIGDGNKLSTKLYDKRDDFNFSIVNFPYLCSNIPTSPAYGVFVSQLIRYFRASSKWWRQSAFLINDGLGLCFSSKVFIIKFVIDIQISGIQIYGR